MKKKRSGDSFVKKPIYLGGAKAMNQLIKSQMKYPAEALKQKIEGTVHLRYEINYKGEVSKSKVISSLGYGCDEEAQRLVKLLTFEMPKIPRKMKLKFNKTIRIHFKLPKLKPKKVEPKPPQVKQQITYQVTPGQTKIKGKVSKPSTGYSYTITVK